MINKYILFIFLMNCISTIGQTRKYVLLEDNWSFQKGEVTNAEQINFDDSKWQKVSVPHDWAIYGPFDKNIDIQKVAIVQNGEKVATEKTGRTGALPHVGTAWYRKNFTINKNDIDKKIILQFEGAMSEPEIFINGKKIGEWKYGYSYFYFDISKVIKTGTNLLAVKLRNKKFASRWYPGAGL